MTRLNCLTAQPSFVIKRMSPSDFSSSKKLFTSVTLTEEAARKQRCQRKGGSGKKARTCVGSGAASCRHRHATCNNASVRGSLAWGLHCRHRRTLRQVHRSR